MRCERQKLSTKLSVSKYVREGVEEACLHRNLCEKKMLRSIGSKSPNLRPCAVTLLGNVAATSLGKPLGLSFRSSWKRCGLTSLNQLT